MSTETIKKTSKAAASKAKPTHPTTSEMVKAAIKSLKERNGSSAQAIKKYIASTYKVDVVKLAPFIKKALRSGVEKGVLAQTKGKGASGSFKLVNKDAPVKKPVVKTVEKKTKSPKKVVKKTAVKKTPKKVVAKKPAAKKAASPKKAAPAKKPAAKKAAPKKVAKKSPKKAAKKA